MPLRKQSDEGGSGELSNFYQPLLLPDELFHSQSNLPIAEVMPGQFGRPTRTWASHPVITAAGETIALDPTTDTARSSGQYTR